MKHMKRVTSFLLAVLLTLSLCVPALALTPKADKEIVKAGEDVNVTLTIDEAMSRISSMQACVYFDGDVFTYKSFTADKEEQMTIYRTDRTSDDGRTYRTIDYVSNGKGKFAAGDEFAVFTFTAKEDINVSKQANFSAYITFRGSLKEDNTPLEEDNVTAEKTLSVTVTPASTAVEGYAVAASAVNPSITVNDKAQVELKISNKDVKTYNAYYMEVSYDTSVLAYESIASTDAKVIDSNGTLKIVGYGAKEGYENLKSIVETDEGSRSLGEIALVGYHSPIQMLGAMFYETLFDENASCHFAIGDCYPCCIEGGGDMTEEQLKEKGLNHSLEHVDFMVGTEDLSIVAEKENGEKLVVFENGDWAI